MSVTPAGTARSPRLRVGVLLGRLAQAAYWAAGVSVSRACAHRAGGHARGDLVQPPVELPVAAEVVLAAEPLARPKVELLERGWPRPLAALHCPVRELKTPEVLVVGESLQ